MPVNTQPTSKKPNLLVPILVGIVGPILLIVFAVVAKLVSNFVSIPDSQLNTQQSQFAQEASVELQVSSTNNSIANIFLAVGCIFLLAGVVWTIVAYRKSRKQ